MRAFLKNFITVLNILRIEIFLSVVLYIKSVIFACIPVALFSVGYQAVKGVVDYCLWLVLIIAAIPVWAILETYIQVKIHHNRKQRIKMEEFLKTMRGE